MLLLHAGGDEKRVTYTFFYAGLIIHLATRWLHFISREPRYSPQTVRQYAHNLKAFLKWVVGIPCYLNLTPDIIIKAISRRDIQRWVSDQKAEGLAPATIRNREATVKEFFVWLTSSAGGSVRTTEDTPYKLDKLISPPPQRGKPRYVTAESVIATLNGLLNESERTLIHALYDIGLRVSEAIRLRRRDLPDEKLFPEGTKYFPIYIPGSKGWGGQIKQRVGLISSPVLARIRRYHNSLEYRFSPDFKDGDPDEKAVFLSVNGRPLAGRSIGKQLKRAAARVGLAPEIISPHRLRHGAAFAILKSELGKDYLDKLLLLQQLFGHNRITTTEIYTVIPPALLSKLNSEQAVTEKDEEAKRIMNATYLPPDKHTEKRGHRRARKQVEPGKPTTRRRRLRALVPARRATSAP
jgi:integrase/recombinase XerD